jgi:DNA-binding CsgD family transcriptional regulator
VITRARPDAEVAELAWLAGDVHAAIEAADRALDSGDDPDARAAGVAAAAAARDAALHDAAARWRRIAVDDGGITGAEAHGRAALGAALTGDAAAATADLAAARDRPAAPAPRGLAVLLDGVEAVLDALRGDITGASARLCGLAASTVPADPFMVETWAELAAAAATAHARDATARAVLARSGSSTTRTVLLGAWLDLRIGKLSDAGAALASVDGHALLRRDAVLAAAVAVGLARRAGGAAPVDAWFRVAHAVAGADVEPLHLDIWGELSVAAAAVSDPAAAAIAQAMDAAVDRAGRPPWAAATGLWWRVQRAAAGLGVVRVEPQPAPGGSAYLDAVGRAAAVWSAVLAGDVDVDAVLRAGTALDGVGRPWEASALCADALERATDPASARRLLDGGRALRGPVAEPVAEPGGLSVREREVGSLVLDGHTQREIGARLFISPKTVEHHVANLRQKLHAGNRAELVAALRYRLHAASHVPSPVTPSRGAGRRP